MDTDSKTVLTEFQHEINQEIAKAVEDLTAALEIAEVELLYGAISQ